MIINIKDTKNYSKINNSQRLSVEVISKDPTYFMKLTKVLTKITNIGFETSFGEEKIKYLFMELFQNLMYLKLLKK